VSGMAKCMDCGFVAWRRRQRAWSSLAGRARTFWRSRKELSVLMPGGGAEGEGGSGGEGHGLVLVSAP